MAAEPADRLLSNLEAESTRHTSPCDHGELVWRQWPCTGGASSAAPLVLLHGGFGSWTHWVANIDGLRAERELWVPDIPGLGDSAELPEPRTPEHFARVLLQGLDHLAGPVSGFELGCFSFGAMIGARMAQQAGSRCHRFTAIGAAGCGELHVQVHLQPPPDRDTPEDEARSIHHANLRALMFSSDDYIDELALRVHGDNLARARFNSRRLSLTDDFLQVLPDVKGELVGVWGTKDATAGHRDSIEKRRQLFTDAQPRADFHMLEGVGHWAMYEDPQAINRILLG